jgi:geranylgeranyl transferase type-2 subunit alpha
LTGRLLSSNPEYYTVWNDRKRILINQFQHYENGPLSPKGLLETELGLFLPLLIKFPKCYWIWNHRIWTLHQLSHHLEAPDARGFWENELKLVGTMLARDARNFHGWGYRRMVVAELESQKLSADANGKESSMAKTELEYTDKMVKANLSNFSAWHARSKLFPRVLEEQGADKTQKIKVLEEELSMIEEALWTDAYDQSLWFYHQHLMTAFSPAQSLSSASIVPELTKDERLDYLEKELGKVIGMVDGAEDCKWIFLALLDLSSNYRTQKGSWTSRVSETEIRKWMESLKSLDTLRRARWEDYEKTLGLS